MNKIKWKTSKSRYSQGEEGFLGSIKIFSASFDGLRPRPKKEEEDNPYKLTCLLSGFKNDLGNFKSIDEAQSKAEMVLDLWLDRIGLSVTDQSSEGK